MLALDDPRWVGLHGGYRVPYDPRDALRLLGSGHHSDAAWAELWQGLHHQNDVGEASYAVVPHLVWMQAQRQVPDWNIYALAATVEEARQKPHNSELPAWLRGSYEVAWSQLSVMAQRDLRDARDPTLVCALFSVLAYAKGQNALGRMALLTEDERIEMLLMAEWG